MKESTNYKHPVYEESYGEFTWCLHCEQAYRTELWVKNEWYCPNQECNGSALDAHPWSKDHEPRDNHPEYPDVPEEGSYYPLY